MDNIDLDDVAVFVRVVEARGFSAAARALRVPKSSVSRRVARLESKLGIRLLHRTTRSLTLTEAGRTYHDRVSVALAAMVDAASAAVEAREVPRGTVRISAPPDVGAEVLPEIVADFVSRYREVRVDVELAADSPNLVEGGYDPALRGGRSPILSWSSASYKIRHSVSTRRRTISPARARRSDPRISPTTPVCSSMRAMASVVGGCLAPRARSMYRSAVRSRPTT